MMKEARIISRLARLGEESVVLVDQRVEAKKKLDKLMREAEELEQELWKEMKRQDVLSSGNIGHKIRKLRWLIELERDLKSIHERVTEDEGGKESDRTAG